MTDLIGFVAIALVLAAASYFTYSRPVDAARLAIREALERGDIRPDQYAAHIRALEDGA